MRVRKQIKLTQRQREALWGDEGPYSQANLIFQVRILDDRISRVFLEVIIELNPFTFEFVKKHREKFKNNKTIQDILDYSEYKGPSEGYVSCIYSREYHHSLLEEANEQLKLAEDTIITMHKFVMQYLDLNIN